VSLFLFFLHFIFFSSGIFNFLKSFFFDDWTKGLIRILEWKFYELLIKYWEPPSSSGTLKIKPLVNSWDSIKILSESHYQPHHLFNNFFLGMMTVLECSSYFLLEWSKTDVSSWSVKLNNLFWVWVMSRLSQYVFKKYLLLFMRSSIKCMNGALKFHLIPILFENLTIWIYKLDYNEFKYEKPSSIEPHKSHIMENTPSLEPWLQKKTYTTHRHISIIRTLEQT
jgi:hypothetical protein